MTTNTLNLEPNQLLLIPEKADREREAVAQAWQQVGGKVLQVGKFWQAPKVGNASVSIYGNDTFALVLAQVLGLVLLMPPDELVTKLPYHWVKRQLHLSQAAGFNPTSLPLFVKSVKPKLLAAQVVRSPEQITAIQALGDEALICAEVVSISAEVRSFILDGQIQALALYEGKADLETARTFIDDFLQIFLSSNYVVALPRTFVLDVGYIASRGWGIIEFNSSWGAGLNHCPPHQVLACIAAATC